MATSDSTLHAQNHELYKVQALISGAIGICDADENPHLFRALRVTSGKINAINDALDALDIGTAVDTTLQQQIDALYDVEGLIVCVDGKCTLESEAELILLLDMASEKIAEIAEALQTIDLHGGTPSVALAA
ncbi:MAG: hypothetical protein ACOY5S_12060 [Pseudomonadota bacterium]